MGPHCSDHELTSPEEELIPYVLRVVAKVAKSRLHPLPSIMYGTTDKGVASSTICKSCKYNAGRYAILDCNTVSESLHDARSEQCMFMRKVSASLSVSVWERALSEW